MAGLTSTPTNLLVAPSFPELVLARLVELALVDDLTFARWWVENRAEHRPRARRALAHELAEKGVSPEVIDEVLTAANDEPAALAAARKYCRQRAVTSDDAFLRRLYGHLLRRGFDYATARRVVRIIRAECDTNTGVSTEYPTDS